MLLTLLWLLLLLELAVVSAVVICPAVATVVIGPVVAAVVIGPVVIADKSLIILAVRTYTVQCTVSCTTSPTFRHR